MGFGEAVRPERNNYCIDHKQKIVWIRVPKVASTSIREGWIDNLKRNESYQEARRHDHYYTIMFVRDPVDRFMSAYVKNWRRYPKKSESYAGQYYVKTITELYEEMQGKDPFSLDRHLRPQWTFAEGLKVDFLGHFETLQEDWAKLQEKFKLNDLPHKMSSGKKKPLSDTLDYKLRQFYQKDYDLYYPKKIARLAGW